jgi:uncharacterized protein YecE (DUF72 family)
MLRVGTSGWQYRHWKGAFYPRDLAAARWLEYYATRFDVVEVNNTFYRLPERDTFVDWAKRTPANFGFAVKASNYLTHRKRLLDPDEPVARLIDHASGLDGKLAVVLLQLPPNLTAAPDRLDHTLRAFKTKVRVAVEPRHHSWFCREVRAVLEAHEAALCWADRGSRVVTPRWQTASWVYVRMHSGRAHPPSCYGERALASWATRLLEQCGAALDGYVFFNNDAHGCALRDASRFARLAEAAGLDVTSTPSAPPLRA